MTSRSAGSPRMLASAAGPSSSDRPSLAYRIAALGLVTLAASAFVNHRLAKKAERDNPPLGRFVEIDGLPLHYLERGTGAPLVLLHGNGTMIEDFVSSGLIDMAARSHRVIAFDRPGFGHTARPRAIVWTAEAQADLIAVGLRRLGVRQATMLGHSWGCAVAIALARRHPDLVSGLVLVSGYYYASVRADVVGASLPSLPVLGDILRFTVSPLVARATWPLATRRMFGPAPVAETFKSFPKEMVFRPSQILASAAEAALMVPGAATAAGYADLKLPVAIIAGEGDRIVDVETQSAGLHAELAQSTFQRVPGAGHMVHQTAPEIVLAAIEGLSAPAFPKPAARSETLPVAA